MRLFIKNLGFYFVFLLMAFSITHQAFAKKGHVITNEPEPTHGQPSPESVLIGKLNNLDQRIERLLTDSPSQEVKEGVIQEIQNLLQDLQRLPRFQNNAIPECPSTDSSYCLEYHGADCQELNCCITQGQRGCWGPCIETCGITNCGTRTSYVYQFWDSLCFGYVGGPGQDMPGGYCGLGCCCPCSAAGYLVESVVCLVNPWAWEKPLPIQELRGWIQQVKTALNAPQNAAATQTIELTDH